MPAPNQGGTAAPAPSRKWTSPQWLLFLIVALWLALGAGFLSLLALDLCLGGFFALKDWLRPLPYPDHRVVAEGYGGEAWVPKLYHEQNRLEAEWSPYTGFQLKPFDGEFTNVAANSARFTWNMEPHHDESTGVLVLGGSSAWGMGARDDQTIPSHLARALYRAGKPAEVVNAAQIGHVQTQELIALIERLKRGERPRVVVFYDGVNDVLAALQSGKAGWPQNVRNRQTEFNLTSQRNRLLQTLVLAAARKSNFARLFDSLARRLALRPKNPPGQTAHYTPELADQIVHQCASNIRLLDALARQYNFQAHCIWQPVLFTKKSLTDYEREKSAQYDWLQEPLGLVRTRLKIIAAAATERVHFHDFSAILDDQAGLIYVDFCHTTEAPNALIAQEIAKLVLEELPRSVDSPGQ